MKTFVESQFNYCSLIWMFHSRQLDNKINNAHKKALTIVYSDYKSTFQELLDKDSFSVHHRNMKECSCLEAFKSKIRKWKPNCPCRSCKTYFQHAGFL